MIKIIVNEQKLKYVQENQPVISPKKASKKVVSQPKSDKFVSTDTKKNIKNALKDGSLVHNKPTMLFGFIMLRRDYYEYTPQKGETLRDIKQKFGIKDGVIKSLNSMYDNDYCPAEDNKNVIFILDK